jgi:Xaa-Pro aminopeptidase
MNSRIKKLKSNLKQDIALFYNKDTASNPNFLYYTDKTNIAGILIVPKNKSPFILTNSRDFEKAKKSKIRIFKYDKTKKSFEYLKQILDKKKNNYKKIGIDKENFNLLVFEKLKKFLKGKYYDISEICKKQRSLKSEEEIKFLKKACLITDNIFKKMIQNFNFKKELEIKNFIEFEINKSNAEVSFKPIVASGKDSSNPHYDENKKLKKGFLILDFGASCNGYHADMTRTLYIGNPTLKQTRYYDLVLDVQKKCLKKISRNMKAKDLYEFACKEFKKDTEYFIHALGHGVGLEIHESPNIGPESKEIFQNNMVFTIEPGVYFEKKFGIRIEDTVLFKNNKVERLTKSKKKLIIVK